MKKDIVTIAYFDVNKKNGGAIFAKNLDLYLNSTVEYKSIVYCNNRSDFSHKYSSDKKSSFLNISIFTFIKSKLNNIKTIELFVHFLRNDLIALILIVKLFFRNKIEKKSIFVFHDHLSLFYFSLFFNINNLKTVLIMHNDGSPDEMVSSGINNKWKKNVLDTFTNFQLNYTIGSISKVIFLCEKAKTKFISKYNVNTNSTYIIHNGLKNIKFNNSFFEDKNKIKFITVCTMNERKGIDIFIRCLPKINQHFENDVHFTLIGNGPLLESLKEISSRYSNVSVIGESNSVNDYLSNSDVFFLLSRTEGQPLSIVEALRASLFVIATDVGCNESMVNESNGLLVEFNDDAVIEAFTKTIANWNNLKSKGINSLKLFNEHFTEDKMYDSYINVFNSLSK